MNWPDPVERDWLKTNSKPTILHSYHFYARN